MSQRLFSGIQPSGTIHLGNYLGAIKNWVALQDKYDSIFCIVDLHAITVPQDPEKLRQNTLDLAKVYLAAGIDTEKSAIFIQSHVREHVELAWILNSLTKVSELERMTQFKDKAHDQRQSTSAGLFTYPTLMAADILLYDTNLVPVGEDQVQHIEITRTLARRFNQRFGKTFIEPEPHIISEGQRIMGLDDPTKKMSKSAESEYNYIALLDSPEKVRDKIKRAVTDSGARIKYGDEQPAIKNLINIYSLLDNIKPQEIEEIYKNKGYAEFKDDLAEVIVEFLKPFQEKYKAIDDGEALRMLQAGKEKVQPLAKEKMEDVQKKIGLI